MAPRYTPLPSKEADDASSPSPAPGPTRRSRLPLLSAFLGGAVLSVLLQCCGSYLLPWSSAALFPLHRAGRYPSAVAPPIKAPAINPWKNLDLAEAVQLRRWLMDPERGLNLTRVENATDSDNWVHMVERAKPDKATVLAYLEGGIESVPVYANVGADRAADLGCGWRRG